MRRSAGSAPRCGQQTLVQGHSQSRDAAPLFPVSFPSDYAKEISEKVGLFATLGMAEDHNGLDNGRLDEAAYLEHCKLVLSERERIVCFELDRFQEGFFFALYDTPDRVQHMMWRFRDEKGEIHSIGKAI